MNDDWVITQRKLTQEILRAVEEIRAMIEAAPKPPASIPTNATHAITTVAINANWPPAQSDGAAQRKAVQDLYYAACWKADRPVDEAALWTAVRDAFGFPKGQSPKPIAQSDAERDAEIARLQEELDELKKWERGYDEWLDIAWKVAEKEKDRADAAERERDEARRAWKSLYLQAKYPPSASAEIKKQTERAERAEASNARLREALQEIVGKSRISAPWVWEIARAALGETK